MKPAAFEYHRVETAEEAVAVLGRLGEDGRVLAGGQSLVPMMNFRLAQPEHLVDINRVGELAYIRRDGGELAIGAMARQAAVERSAEVRADVPLLSDALRFVAHPPIRHRGTVVGSIAHADPAAELPGVAVACNARLVLTSTSGSRTVSADDFFLGPFETVLEPGELVTEVRFPKTAPATRHAFVEFARRHGDFAIAGAAVTLRFEGDRVADAAIVLVAVGPRPYRAASAEQLLRGQVPDAELVAAVVERAVVGLQPGADIHGGTDYRVGVARAQVRRALLLALAPAGGGHE
jgi:aerobic carbon-monoxide dehydrogenase medium subunit